MRSRDGLALVNQVLQENAATRRTFLQQLGWTGLATLGGLGLAQVRPVFGQQVRRGGTIKLGIGENIDTLDPHQTTIITAVAIHNNIYNGLLKIAYDGNKVEFVPDLARSWDVVGDRTHVFRLRRGVKFHDGTDLTAEVVKWNLERVQESQAVPHSCLEAQTAGEHRDPRRLHRALDLCQALSLPTCCPHRVHRPRRHHRQPQGSGAMG